MKLKIWKSWKLGDSWWWWTKKITDMSADFCMCAALLYICAYLVIHSVNLLYQSQELLMPHNCYTHMPGVRLDEPAPCLPQEGNPLILWKQGLNERCQEMKDMGFVNSLFVPAWQFKSNISSRSRSVKTFFFTLRKQWK